MTDGEKRILFNLRFQYGKQIEHIPDNLLLERFNFWNQSAKDEDCLVWLLDE